VIERNDRETKKILHAVDLAPSALVALNYLDGVTECNVGVTYNYFKVDADLIPHCRIFPGQLHQAQGTTGR
jgi:hypothetical protein